MVQLLKAALAGLAFVLSGVPVVAQQTQAPASLSILTIVPDRLYAETLYGQRIERDLSQARSALISQNQRLDAELSVEERSLAERRPTMVAAAFRALADEFDRKVQAIRESQDAKQRDLTRQRDEGRQAFFADISPILTEITVERGAVLLMDRRAVLLAVDGIDITDTAITRIDAVFGEGPLHELQNQD